MTAILFKKIKKRVSYNFIFDIKLFFFTTYVTDNVSCQPRLAVKNEKGSKGINRANVLMMILFIFGFAPLCFTTIVLVKYLAKVLEKYISMNP